MRKIITKPLLMLLLGGLAACVTKTAGTNVPAVEVLSKSVRCSFFEEEGKAIWLANEEHLTAEWKKIDTQGLSFPAVKAPEIDFAHEGVVAVFMGQRSTAGHYIALEPQTPIIEKGAMLLSLQYVSPPEGAMAAQVMTSPCLLVKVKKGTFESIHIVDQIGQLRHVVDLH